MPMLIFTNWQQCCSVLFFMLYKQKLFGWHNVKRKEPENRGFILKKLSGYLERQDSSLYLCNNFVRHILVPYLSIAIKNMNCFFEEIISQLFWNTINGTEEKKLMWEFRMLSNSRKSQWQIILLSLWLFLLQNEWIAWMIPFWEIKSY